MSESPEAFERNVPEEIEALLKSEDYKEILTEISLSTYFKLADWWSDLSDRRKRIFTESIVEEQYEEHLHPQLVRKFLEVALGYGLNPDNRVVIPLSYREVDSMFLYSFSEDQEFEYVDDIYRESMRSGKFDKFIAFHAGDLKGPLLELVDSFVRAGGKDGYGHLETLKRVAMMRVKTVLHWEADSVDLIEEEGETGSFREE